MSIQETLPLSNKFEYVAKEIAKAQEETLKT